MGSDDATSTQQKEPPLKKVRCERVRKESTPKRQTPANVGIYIPNSVGNALTPAKMTPVVTPKSSFILIPGKVTSGDTPRSVGNALTPESGTVAQTAPVHGKPVRWQKETATIAQRDKNLLEWQILIDCIVYVGEEEKEFPCHRAFLAKTSSMFEDALRHGDTAEKAILHFPSVTPAAFEAVLQYIYEGEVYFKDFNSACAILSAALFFDMPQPFEDRVRSYLWGNIYPANVWTALTFARSHDEPQLLQTALQILSKKMLNLLDNESFLNLPQPSLVDLLEQKFMHQGGHELQVFKSCVEWARQDVKKKGKMVSPATVRESILPILPHIRVLSIKKEEFATDEAAFSEVYTPDEMFSISLNMLVPGCKMLPHNVSSNREVEVDTVDHSQYFVYGQSKDIKRNNTLDVFTKKEFTKSELKNKKFVSINTQIKTNEKEEEEYYENLTVIFFKEKVEDGNSKLIILGKATKAGWMKFNSTTDIKLPPELSLARIDSEDIVSIKVMFHQTGVYPQFSATLI